MNVHLTLTLCNSVLIGFVLWVLVCKKTREPFTALPDPTDEILVSDGSGDMHGMPIATLNASLTSLKAELAAAIASNTKAIAANASAIATKQPTGDYLVRGATYKMTADGHSVGRGAQDNWGERYLTWENSKITNTSSFQLS